MTLTDADLTAEIEPFDSFWEAPEDIESGYAQFGQFYRNNYLSHFPEDRDARILVVSCGPGYMVDLLGREGYSNVVGIDSVAEKIEHARRRNLNCRQARALRFLRDVDEPFDAIFAEQELNHLTKDEIRVFLDLCREKLVSGGRVIVHSINGANPMTGSESRAGNFDHYNAFTEYSLRQIFEHMGYRNVEVFPLNLYVFWLNPFNYVALAAEKVLHLFYRANYVLVGKHARIFTKKIAAVARK
jgi:cyclopropane fatty-acyl-phospholipid synthase-like methyltransferase